MATQYIIVKRIGTVDTVNGVPSIQVLGDDDVVYSIAFNGRSLASTLCVRLVMALGKALKTKVN